VLRAEMPVTIDFSLGFAAVSYQFLTRKKKTRN
jgi:hypothetical protein